MEIAVDGVLSKKTQVAYFLIVLMVKQERRQRQFNRLSDLLIVCLLVVRTVVVTAVITAGIAGVNTI